MQRIAAVFGGRHPERGDFEYEESRKLGRLLAEAGYAVMNGGYGGVMEAVSRGAIEAGGHTIGVTMDVFAELPPNAYLKEQVRTRHFFDRLEVLISRSQAFIAVRGGMGTLTEISLVWNMLQTRTMEPRPLILVGAFWRPLLRGLAQGLVIPEGDFSLFTVVDTVDDAVRCLRTHHA